MGLGAWARFRHKFYLHSEFLMQWASIRKKKQFTSEQNSKYTANNWISNSKEKHLEHFVIHALIFSSFLARNYLKNKAYIYTLESMHPSLIESACIWKVWLAFFVLINIFFYLGDRRESGQKIFLGTSKICLLIASTSSVMKSQRWIQSVGSRNIIFTKKVVLNHNGTVKYLSPRHALLTVAFASRSTLSIGTALITTCECLYNAGISVCSFQIFNGIWCKIHLYTKSGTTKKPVVKFCFLHDW